MPRGRESVIFRKGSYNLRLSEVIQGDPGGASDLGLLLCPADAKMIRRVTGTEDRKWQGVGCVEWEWMVGEKSVSSDKVLPIHSRAHKF